MYIVRAIENCLNEIALAYLLFQNIIQRIREKEFVGGCTVIKRDIIAAAAEFVIAFPALLDIDGDCGGYNLQWAWSSGLLAGTYAGGRI